MLSGRFPLFPGTCASLSSSFLRGANISSLSESDSVAESSGAVFRVNSRRRREECTH